MRYRWSALAVVVLALALMPRDGLAQKIAQRPEVTVKQNYPNPFNPETWGDFGIPCTADLGLQRRVSVKIYNLLMQPVATPELQGGKGSVAGGSALTNVLLPCGDFTWHWDGNYRGTSKEAASGIYLVVIEVEGLKTRTIKIMNAK